jgi:hypothetical protein
MGIKSIRHIYSKVPLTARIQLLHALVLSHLNYASVLLNGISQCNKDKLEKQLNWGIRVCYGVPARTNCDELKLRAGILNTEQLRKYFSLNKFAAIYTHTSMPFCNIQFPNFYLTEHKRTGRLSKKKFKKKVYENSFLNNAISFWNDVPGQIKIKAGNHKVFKKWSMNHMLVEQCKLPSWRIQNTWRGHNILQ